MWRKCVALWGVHPTPPSTPTSTVCLYAGVHTTRKPATVTWPPLQTMLFLREYGIEVGFNPLEPSGSQAAAANNAIPTRVRY